MPNIQTLQTPKELACWWKEQRKQIQRLEDLDRHAEYLDLDPEEEEYPQEIQECLKELEPLIGKLRNRQLDGNN